MSPFDLDSAIVAVTGETVAADGGLTARYD
jgi:hypothetical protein